MNGKFFNMTFDKSVLMQIVVVVVIIVLMWVLMRVNRMLFREIRKKQEGLHLVFFERISKSFILISGTILALSGFGGLGSVWKTFPGGTAIISAVLAFSAQDVIKDVLGGLFTSRLKSATALNWKTERQALFRIPMWRQDCF